MAMAGGRRRRTAILVVNGELWLVNDWLFLFSLSKIIGVRYFRKAKLAKTPRHNHIHNSQFTIHHSSLSQVPSSPTHPLANDTSHYARPQPPAQVALPAHTTRPPLDP